MRTTTVVHPLRLDYTGSSDQASNPQHQARLSPTLRTATQTRWLLCVPMPKTATPIATTGLLRDGDGTFRCFLCGITFNGRWLNHYCAKTSSAKEPHA